MLIDSHTHLNFNAFKDDAEQIIDNCLKNDIWLINVGSQYSTSQRAVEIAEKYSKGVYAAVGLHPIHLQEMEVDVQEGGSFKTQAEEFEPERYKDLAISKKVVAIGETGFDFFHIKKGDEKIKEKQKQVFIQQLNLAKELNLPVIFHCRDAYDEMLDVLREQSGLNGMIHCFGGNLKQAQEFINLGFYIGFTGTITFEPSSNVQREKQEALWKVVKEIPIEKILIETDCPYLAPQPYRGQRNQPQYVKFVAEKIAEIKKMEYNKIVDKTTTNTINLFKLN